ncbi:hypothetical protein Ssi03_62500 [Sphaerisporangium siamense]|uniref:Uncharacterized protein n=1 Tax=Sphaerisporangium siamense TaxID=795645 RepID=A0A7W7DAV2_9ACTN|nr:hypothetical protein [Sphaerisporangium siamense]MBB4702560.1 hypothetical protein [Sphaerisporangium siamense]GII88260.1 hypothetical protein Ssi03_62500 [Sphaerisporangium siamense]
MTPAEEVSGFVAELKPLIDQLRELLPEQVADATRGSVQHHKITGSPAPWHPEAGPVLMTIHAGVRQLEQDLRYRVTGHTGERGGSDGNTTAALDAIVKLVYGVPEDVARDARRRLEGWIEQSQEIRDIGESETWIPIRVPRGDLPPGCPYCKTYSLRLATQSGRVACMNAKCTDSNGNRPKGMVDKNYINGDAVVAWADGRTIYYKAAA